MDNFDKNLLLLKKNTKYINPRNIYELSSNDRMNNLNNNKLRTYSTEEASTNTQYRNKNTNPKKLGHYNSTDNINKNENIYYKNEIFSNSLQNNTNNNNEKNYINNVNESNKKSSEKIDIIPKINDYNAENENNTNYLLLRKNKIFNQQKSQIEFNKLLKEIKDYTEEQSNRLYQKQINYRNENYDNFLNDNFDKKRKTESNYYNHAQNNFYNNVNFDDINNFDGNNNNIQYINKKYKKNEKINNLTEKNKIISYMDDNENNNNRKNSVNNSNSLIHNNLSLSQVTNSIFDSNNNQIHSYELYNINNNSNYENNNENNYSKENNNLIGQNYHTNNYFDRNDYSNENKNIIRKNCNTNNYFERTDYPKEKNNEIYLKISRFEMSIKCNGMNNYENKKLIKIYEKEIQRLNQKLNDSNNKIKEFMKLLINNKNENQLLKEELNKIKKELFNKNKNIKDNSFKKKRVYNKNNIIGRNKNSFILKLPDSFMTKNNNYDTIHNESKISQKNSVIINNTKIPSKENNRNKNNSINSEIYKKKISKKQKRSNSQPNINKIDLGLNDIGINNIDINKLNSQRNETKKNNKLIFIIYPNIKNLKLLTFDIEHKQFTKRNFVDLGNFNKSFLESFRSDESQYNTIFLMHKKYLYIVTGKNSDLFYIYNPHINTINKICKLKNNHANGVLITFQYKLFCLSGKFNKKVEIYMEMKREWYELKEMNIERSFFSACIIRNKYLFCLYGYNTPTNKYLDSIEYYDINNDDKGWRYLKMNNPNLLKMNICGFMCLNYKDEKIIIFGGINGIEENPVNKFYQIILGKDFDNNTFIEEIKRKPKDIYKNIYYYFANGYGQFEDKNKNIYYTAFDNNYNVHIIQLNNLISHDIYYLNK